jgi:hypothetical protein
MARPAKPVDPAQVKVLASYGLTNREIAALFDIHESNIGRRFGKELAFGRAVLRKRLRRKQIEVAMKGNATMLIWLGKNALGQSDSPTDPEEPEPELDEKVG